MAGFCCVTCVVDSDVALHQHPQKNCATGWIACQADADIAIDEGGLALVEVGGEAGRFQMKVWILRPGR